LNSILGIANANSQGIGSNASTLAGIGQNMQAGEDAKFAGQQQTLSQLIGLIKYYTQKNKGTDTKDFVDYTNQNSHTG
jgi:hypothetical protein